MTTISNRRRLGAMAVTIGMLIAGLNLTIATPAHAAKLAVDFTITKIAVSGAKDAATLTLTGTVRNTGEVPAYGVHVVLWREPKPLDTVGALSKATRKPTSEWGSQLWVRPDHWASVTNSVTALKPGAEQPVELKATLGELGLTTKPAVYAVGAQVFATDDQSSNYQLVGDDVRLLPRSGKSKPPLTSIVLLSAIPTKLVDGVFRNDDLTKDLTGRLDELLEAAALPGMSWLIDPALLDEVRDMADGYRIGTDLQAKPGTGSAVAQAWLARFNLLDRENGGRTLFASTDVTAAQANGDEELLRRAEVAASSVAGIADLPLIVLPRGSKLTQETYDFLATVPAAAVIAANTVTPGVWQGTATGPNLLVTTGLADSATDPQQAVDFNQATVVVAPNSGLAHLLTTPAQVKIDQDQFTGLVTRRGLGELLKTEPIAAGPLTSTKPKRLSDEQVRAINRISPDFDAFAELAPTSNLGTQRDIALARAASTRFVGHEGQFDQHLRGLDRLVGSSTVRQSVHLEASPRFLMSAKANQFPVTISNDLTEPIRVKVVVTTDSPQRLKVPASDLVTVEPGRHVTVNIQPEATSNGLVMARAHLATESGQRVSGSVPIAIEVTNLGVVAWIIVITSGVLLVGATGWRIRQVRRRAAQHVDPQEAE